MSPSFTLKEGACIISDAHYSHRRPQLLFFLKEIESGAFSCSQLLFMGDILDALFGNVAYTQSQNSEIVATLQSISEKIEVIYLEGNHDFYLKNIFPKMQIFPLQKQPVRAVYQDKMIAFAHGDFDLGLAYRVYCAFIRNPFVLMTLGLFDALTSHSILKNLDNHLSKKDDCREFIGFESYIKKRSLKKYGCDYFIEGHYHQNQSFLFEEFGYINLGAFACNQRYFIVKSTQDNELLEENSYKEIK